MSELPSPPPHPTDDEVRWLMVRTAASLGRLWTRLERFCAQPGRPARHHIVARDIQPREPWLASVPGNVGMTGVIHAVMLAQSLLIDDAVSRDSPDRRRACLIVQHVSCGATDWSEYTLRTARKLGVTLADTVWKETFGTTLAGEIFSLDGTYAEARRARVTPDVHHHAH
jgi:hypothetical protein